MSKDRKFENLNTSCTQILEGETRTPIYRQMSDLTPGHRLSILNDQLIISVQHPCVIDGREITRIGPGRQISVFYKPGFLWFCVRVLISRPKVTFKIVRAFG